MVQVNRKMCLTDARFRDILCDVSCSTMVRSTQKRFRCTFLTSPSACVLSQSMHLFCSVSSMCNKCTLSPISLAGFLLVVDVTPKDQNWNISWITRLCRSFFALLILLPIGQLIWKRLQNRSQKHLTSQIAKRDMSCSCGYLVIFVTSASSNLCSWRTELIFLNNLFVLIAISEMHSGRTSRIVAETCSRTVGAMISIHTNFQESPHAVPKSDRGRV